MIRVAMGKVSCLDGTGKVIFTVLDMPAICRLQSTHPIQRYSVSHQT